MFFVEHDMCGVLHENDGGFNPCVNYTFQDLRSKKQK